jgi:hypothetical protein
MGLGEARHGDEWEQGETRQGKTRPVVVYKKFRSRIQGHSCGVEGGKNLNKRTYSNPKEGPDL